METNAHVDFPRDDGSGKEDTADELPAACLCFHILGGAGVRPCCKILAQVLHDILCSHQQSGKKVCPERHYYKILKFTFTVVQPVTFETLSVRRSPRFRTGAIQVSDTSLAHMTPSHDKPSSFLTLPNGFCKLLTCMSHKQAITTMPK